jgi:hypothetical protein
MRRLLTTLLALTFFALPLAAQESLLFPRFSITGGASAAQFETNVRLDPDTATSPANSALGTRVNLERDLGLDDARTVQRYGVQWRPFARHELAATYFSTSRDGLQQIDRELTFRDRVYPVSALVSTRFDLDYRSLTYTYWARRSDHDGIGITLGASTLSLDASIVAQRPDATVTATERAKTDVPVALAGLQGRVALTRRLHGEASISTLPRVTIEGYTGHALTGSARLEYRATNWLGIGAAYHYFRLDVDVAQSDLRGSLDMTIKGPEAFLRVAF